VLLANRLVASGTPDAVLKPDHLEEAYAGRIVHVELECNHEAVGHVLLDEHGHGSEEACWSG